MKWDESEWKFVRRIWEKPPLQVCAPVLHECVADARNTRIDAFCAHRGYTAADDTISEIFGIIHILPHSAVISAAVVQIQWETF